MNRSQLKIETYRILERIVGRDKIKDMYLKRCVKRYLNADCIFIHIPKSAGTSVANAVIGTRAGHFTSQEVFNRMGKEAYTSLFSFAVTREPVSKLVSAYNYIRNGGGTDGGVRSEEIFNSKEFRSFESFVGEWLVHQDLSNSNLLFKPQSEFVLNNRNETNVNYIGKVEELGLVEKEVSEILNREIKFGLKNRTPNIQNPNIDDGTKSLIKELYYKDYELFNY